MRGGLHKSVGDKPVHLFKIITFLKNAYQMSDFFFHFHQGVVIKRMQVLHLAKPFKTETMSNCFKLWHLCKQKAC